MKQFRRLMVFITISLSAYVSFAQPAPASTKVNKPYKILTSGKQITIKSSKNIQSIMVWTASGHRIVEQREVNTNTYSFNTNNVGEKVFFIMIGYEGQQPFTEKIGAQ